MVCGAEVPAVAVPPGCVAAGHAVFHDWSGSWRGYAGDRALDEHRFPETLQDRLLGVTAHVSLTRPGTSGIKNYEEMATKLAEIPGVRSVTPAVYQTVLLSFAGQARGVVTKGIDPERERKSDEALQRIIAGRLDFSQDADGIDG